MEIVLDNSIPIDSWRLLLESNKYNTPFQTPEFFKLINSVKNLSARAIAVAEYGKLLALAVITFQRESGWKGYFSRRAIIYGGPLINNDNEALSLLLDNIAGLTKKNSIYIETRNFNDYLAYKNIFKNAGYDYIESLNFQIETSDPEKLLKSMSSSRARQIRKAKRNNVKWKIADNIDEVRIFYNLLSDLYKKRIRKPLFPYEFFENFFKSDIGKYILILWEGKIIGGIMCPINKNKAIYEFYICGLDTEYKEQYPSVMATWAAIEYANKNNIPLFDFMGAGKPDEQYGVRDFKARFGGELVEYGRFLKINNPFLYAIGRFGIKLAGGFKR